MGHCTRRLKEVSQEEEPQEQPCRRSREEGCRDGTCKGPEERLETQGWEGSLAGLPRSHRALRSG